MTRPPIEEFEKLLEAATPGPWKVDENPHGGAHIETPGVAIADVKSRGGVPHPTQKNCLANANLIASAPTTIATLIAYVKELEAENERLNRILDRDHKELYGP